MKKFILFASLFLSLSISNLSWAAEEPLPADPNSPATSETARREFYFSVTPALILGGSARFSSAAIYDSGTYSSGEVAYTLKSGLSIKLQFAHDNKESFNAVFGGGYEFARKIDSVALNLGGTSLSGTADGSFKTLFASGGFNYRWDVYYLGLSYAIASVQGENLPAALKDFKGNMGADINMGWYVTPDMAIDLSFRGFTLNTKQYSNGGSWVDLGTGMLAGTNLGLKYVFR